MDLSLCDDLCLVQKDVGSTYLVTSYLVPTIATQPFRKETNLLTKLN